LAGCSSSPQKGVVVSGMKLSSLPLIGLGVVGAKLCGVDGGATGRVFRLVGTGLVDRSDMDGKMKDAAIDIGSLDSVDGEAARNQPLGSRRLDFTIVADARLTTRHSMRLRPKWKAGRMSDRDRMLGR
jgi:hypothetical protein